MLMEGYCIIEGHDGTKQDEEYNIVDNEAVETMSQNAMGDVGCTYDTKIRTLLLLGTTGRRGTSSSKYVMTGGMLAVTLTTQVRG